MSIEKQIKTVFWVNVIVTIFILAAVTFGVTKCASWVMSGDAAKDVGSHVKVFKDASR